MSEGPGNEQLLAGRYRLLDELGRGGMGVVWRARDEVLGREVAIKEVRAPRALTEREEQLLYARLEREGRAAARISHPNVVTVYDVATSGGRPWIVMELIRGLSLADALTAEGPMPPARAARIGAEVLAALREAHSAGVLHRDVKPGNVLLANDGRVVLTDFGIATVAGSSALTLTGELVGSPEFLAPERALGRTPGPESDLWSLGVTLYAAVEGHSPFRQDTPLTTLRAVVDEELPPPRRAGALAPVLEGLLRKDPGERLDAQTTQRMLQEVASGGQPRTVSVPPPAAPYTPTTAEPGPTRTAYGPAGPPPPAPPPGGAATTATTAPGEPSPRRRSVALLALGGLLAALIAAGVTWALVGGDGTAPTAGGGTPGSAGNGGTAPAGSGGGNTTGDGGGSGGGSTPSRTATGHGGTTTAPPPAVTVTVYVTPVRAAYRGACPPPAAEVPSFRAEIKVSRVPADVVYRWRTSSGQTSDPAWKTVPFAAGDSGRLVVQHEELTYKDGATLSDWISVQVKSPQSVRSNRVAFTVTCEEAPTDGASPSTPTPSGTHGTYGAQGARRTGQAILLKTGR